MIISVRHKVDMKRFIAKWAVQHVAKVTLLNENTFIKKFCRSFEWSCFIFSQMLNEEFDLFLLPKKSPHSVLENELFISGFSSELRIRVIVRAGYRTSMHFEYRPKCAHSIKYWKHSSMESCHQEVWTCVTNLNTSDFKIQIQIKKSLQLNCYFITNDYWPLDSTCLTWKDSIMWFKPENEP